MAKVLKDKNGNIITTLPIFCATDEQVQQSVDNRIADGTISMPNISESILILKDTLGLSESVRVTVSLSSVATLIEENKRANGETTNGFTRYKLEGIKKGDVIKVIGSCNGETKMFYDGTNLTSLAYQSGNYYTFTADKDYSILYTCTYGTNAGNLTYTPSDYKQRPSYNNEFVPTISDEVHDLKVFSSKKIVDLIGYDLTGMNAKSELNGSTCIAMGDSYTYGMKNNLNALGTKYGMTVDNRGYVASTISGNSSGSIGWHNMWSRTNSVCSEYITNGTTDNVKLILFMGGANDGFGINTWIGSGINDTNKEHIYGAMHSILNNFRKTFKNAKIIVILQPSHFNKEVSSVTDDTTAQVLGFNNLAEVQALDNYQFSNYSMFKKEKAVKDVAEFYNCSIVDCCFDWHSVLNESDRAKYWQSDKLHLTAIGYQEITDAIENKIIEIFGKQ